MRQIIINPNICHGKAHIKDTRIPVHIILDRLAAGETHKNILRSYTQFNEEDILSCIYYAAKIATEEIVHESEMA